MALAKIQKTIFKVDSNTLPAAGHTYSIQNSGGGSAIPIYANSNGTVPLDNPGTLPANGLLSFFLRSGTCRIKVTDPITLEEQIWDDEPCISPDVLSSASATLQFETLADLVNGNPINKGETVDFADYVGQKVSAVVNNTTSNKGGEEYIIKTAAQVVADGDIIDGHSNHWLLGDTDYAAVITSEITPERVGHKTSNTPESVLSAIAAQVGSGECDFVILGDSTECGVGAGGGPYGQTTSELENGGQNRFGFSLIKADPNFVDVDNGYQDFREPPLNAIANVGYDTAGFVVSEAPRYETWVNSKARNLRDGVTVYYVQRTADTAARADISVYDTAGALITTQKLDSYSPQMTFGAAGSFDVEPRLAKFTISLGAGYRNVRVVIDNVDVIDRGSGVAPDGTLLVYGFTIGDGISINNLAVSSTTLTEGSAANVSRGVDTSERVALLKTLGADVVYIGWGTNDSKVGVTNLVDFTTEYLALIDDLISWKSDIKIILGTDPEGAGGSIYENNPEYNEAVRRIAKMRGLPLFDVEKIFKSGPSSWYADDVHPSSYGYQAIHYSLCSFVGIDPFEKVGKNYLENRSQSSSYSYTIPVSTDTGGTFVSAFSQAVTKPTWAKGYTVEAIINLALSSDIDECAGRLEIQANTVAEQVVTNSAVSGVSPTVMILKDSRDFALYQEQVTIEIFLRDYGIRVTDSESKVFINFH